MKNHYLVAAAVLALLLHVTTAPAEDRKGETQTQTQPQSQPQTEVIVTYDVILKGTFSGLKDPLQAVIQSEKDFEDLWKKHTSVLVPQPQVPSVDFETSVIVAIATGEKTTSGYQILVKNVEPQGNNVLVHYKQTEPPPNSFLLQVLTQPFLLLRVDKPRGQVQLVKE